MTHVTHGRHSGNKGRIYEPLPPQAHDVWEILLILEGTGYLQAGGQRYPFDPGTFFCIPPLLEHQVVPDAYFNDYCIGVHTPLLLGSKLYLFHDDKDQTFYHLIHLFDHVNQRKPVNSENILASLEAVIQHILLCWSDRQPNAELQQLTQLLRENSANPGFKASDALAKIPMNSDYVRKQFHELYGCTPVAYLNALRVEDACKHLILTDMPISELAGHVGFSDARYFTRVFRNATGLSATEYRKQAQAGKAARKRT